MDIADHGPKGRGGGGGMGHMYGSGGATYSTR